MFTSETIFFATKWILSQVFLVKMNMFTQFHGNQYLECFCSLFYVNPNLFVLVFTFSLLSYVIL
jgi:hypothetical protein